MKNNSSIPNKKLPTTQQGTKNSFIKLYPSTFNKVGIINKVMPTNINTLSYQ